MEFFDGIKTFLFLVSSILLYPVLLLLALSALWLIWEAGRFLGEWMERSRDLYRRRIPWKHSAFPRRCAGTARSCGTWIGRTRRR